MNKIMKEFDECLETWNDLPNYVYTEEYRKAFKKFIQKKVDVGQSIDEFVVVMTLHHETDGRLPYFEFDRR